MLQISIFLLILILCVKPLGWYMAQIYQGKPCGLNRLLAPVERVFYQLCGIASKRNMDWKQYLTAMLIFNLLGILLLYFLQRLQGVFPLNPQHFPSLAPDLAFNVAASFATNTDWQAYSGETSISYFTQMLGFTTQNFLSAASGMSILIALIRGLTQAEGNTLGNFWVDTTRGILYILLPLSLLLAFVLVSEGVIQNLKPNLNIPLIQATELTTQLTTEPGPTSQIIPMGPVASQIAIKQLGTNGGGFFNTNAAHPFENPTPFSNFLETLAILLIPAALTYTFGILIKDRRQGWLLLSAMLLIFIPFLVVEVCVEQTGNPAFPSLGIDQTAHSGLSPGGNMEGKETRFGIVSSALWTTATTAASNGATNSMLDSYTPIGGLIPLWMMHLGEVVFGGVGQGLAGLLILVIITVFVAGLMVGRTPEYLGKKIEPYEMKMACLAILVMPLSVLVSTAISAVTPLGISAVSNPGPHGFTEMLYAFTSMANNNGSSFAGLNANTPFYTILGGIVMLIGRYWIALPILAIAGSLVKKKIIPNTSGTLATHTPLFLILLISVTLLFGALSFLPTLALGPIAEDLILKAHYEHILSHVIPSPDTSSRSEARDLLNTTQNVTGDPSSQAPKARRSWSIR